MPSSLDDCRIYALPRVVDARGCLSFVEGGRHCPFDIARLFYMYGFARGTTRGGHAHKGCQQFLIAQEGRFEIRLWDGDAERLVVLERPDQGLHIPAGIWVTLTSLEDQSVITALASAPYEESDYLRDREAFRAWRAAAAAAEPLTDGRIVIRPYVPSDAPAFAASVRASVAEVGRWLSWCTPAFGEEQAAAYIRKTTPTGSRMAAYSFGIFEPGPSGAHLGGVAINRIEWDARSGNLGYWVATRAAGRGVATAAARLACGFGFGTLGLRRIEILVADGNTGSRRVAERLGARHEARLRARVSHEGGALDADLFALVAGDAGDAGGGR